MLDKEALSHVGANKLWVDDEEADAEKAFQGGYILGDPHLKFIPTHQTLSSPQYPLHAISSQSISS
jgi:hypothetical protein